MERLAALYGYRPIQTPVFEDTELFLRTSGAGLRRRPEGDVHVRRPLRPVADAAPGGDGADRRAYVEHGLHREPQPQKLYTIGPMYRYGAPGRGRYREHWQLSVEAIGTDDPAIDAEIIQLYDTLLRRLGITSYRLELNSIGCRECRPAYVERLTRLARRARGRARRGGAAEAARRARCASSTSRTSGRARCCEDAPKIGDSLCDACVDALRRGPGRPRRDRRRLRARADARARARLLLAHDLGVHRPDGQRELDHLRRRPLRLPRRGDRRAADAGRRLRRRDRAAADRDGGRGRRRRRRRRPSTSSSRSSPTHRASSCRRC